MLQESTVTTSSLRKMMGAMRHEGNVRRKMDSQPKPSKLSQTETLWLEWKQDFIDYLRIQVNCYDVSLLYVLADEDFKVETDTDAMLVKVIKLREDETFRDDFEADDKAVHEIFH